MVSAVLFLAAFFAALIALAIPLGRHMALVYQGERTFLHPILRPLETLIYRACGIREEQEMPAGNMPGRSSASRWYLSSRSSCSSFCSASCP